VTKDEIRALFIDFFVQRGHVLLPNTSLIPDDDTVLFTIAGVQQVQPFFMGMAEPPARRLVNVQRCLRTVDIEEVGDDSHLTLFEMLGNWSIGDYFKQDAVRWSWDLCRQAGFPLERIWITVYRGDDGTVQDDETYALWREAGVPAERITYLGEKDNWWAPGAIGPCGPDTEMFYDRGEEYGCGRDDCRPGCDCDRFLEFWNNVFTQYYRAADGTLTALEHKNVDTGAGLERWAMLLQGKRSVFETDVFAPLIASIEEATGARFGGAVAADRSLRIIADHGRALTMLIYDGVTPSPKGRGSVLRTLLRRAVLHGRLLGLTKPFLADLVVPTVVKMMAAAYADLPERAAYMAQVADVEERQFLRTIEAGYSLAEELIERAVAHGETVVDGAAAYNLLQMRGFPLEIVKEMAAGRGLSVDVEAFDRNKAVHRGESRSAKFGDDKEKVGQLNKAYGEIVERLGRAPDFLGYDQSTTEGRVVGLIDEAAATTTPEAQEGDAVYVVLDRTPFYAESGGQIGDRGTLAVGDVTVTIMETQRPKGTTLIVHRGMVKGGSLHLGDEVEARVNVHLRRWTARHHSATHLLHHALKDVLGDEVHQEGSVVGPNRLTFDFNLPRAITPQEVLRVEHEVNRVIRADVPVTTAVMPYAEALQTGAMALFSEKYGDTVRVVSMADSRELCGGTHVERTGQLGVFAVVSESGVSAGVRRIEAVAGEPALHLLHSQREDLRLVARELETQPSQVPARVVALRERERGLERQLDLVQQELAALKTQIALGAAGAGAGGAEEGEGFRFVVTRVEAASPDELERQSDAFKSRLAPSCVVVLGAVVEGRALFTAAATRDVADRGTRAGDIVKAMNAATGAKGGGGPTWAKASAADPDALDAGLAAARDLLRGGTGRTG